MSLTKEDVEAYMNKYLAPLMIVSIETYNKWQEEKKEQAYQDEMRRS